MNGKHAPLDEQSERERQAPRNFRLEAEHFGGPIKFGEEKMAQMEGLGLPVAPILVASCRAAPSNRQRIRRCRFAFNAPKVASNAKTSAPFESLQLCGLK